MAIFVTCPCGRQLAARDEHAGKRVRCPSCGRELMVPILSPVSPASAPIPQAEPPMRSPRRPAETSGTSVKALVSLILGIVSLVCIPILPGIVAVVFGILALRDISRSRGALGGNALAIAGLATGALSVLIVGPISIYVTAKLLAPAITKVREAAERLESSNNLKSISVAIHNYHNDHRQFPGNITSKDRRPLLSWRVAILPYLDDKLYKEFRLDEPWDSPHNKKLLDRMPADFALPGAANSGMTHYRGFAGKGAMFEPNVRITMATIKDGSSNTILVVEAREAVPWTKPEDLPFDPKGPLPPLGREGRDSFNALMCDGSVRPIRMSMKQETLRALIGRDDGVPVEDF